MSASLDITAPEPKTTTPAAPATADLPTWEELLEVLDEHLPPIAAFGREQRATGMTVSVFAELFRRTASDAALSAGLKAVFALSGDDDLNLSQDEIEFALDELKHDAEPSAVIEQIKRDRSGKEAWQAAVAAYHTAADAIGQGVPSKRFAPGSAWRAMFEDVPDELVRPSTHYPVHLRWHSAECVRRDIRVDPKDRERLAALVEHWAPIISERIDKKPDDYPDDESLDSAFDDAELALFSIPAPDGAAALFKAELLERTLDDDGQGFDDLGRVCFKQNYYYDDRRAVWAFIDLLNATRTDHPILHMDPFVPLHWIAAFEADGGIVSCPGLEDSVLILFRKYRPKARRALEALIQSPWKLRAVFFEAQRRRGDGGDPLVDHQARHGIEDGRGGKAERLAKLNGYLGEGVSVSFTKEAGEIVPVIERVNLTWGLQ